MAINSADASRALMCAMVATTCAVAQPCKVAVACCACGEVCGALHTRAADRSGTEWLWTLQDLPRVIRKGDRRLEIVVLEASVWTKLG